MKKKWILLSIPFLFNLLSCEGFSTGGNPGQCQEILRKHVSSLRFSAFAKCPYEKDCDIYMGVEVFKLGDSLKNKCFDEYELTLKTQDTSMVVNSSRRYLLPLTSDGYLHFSLIDEDGVEKKYDFDLSGIIHSFTVRGDSVDVNVMKDCRLYLFSCKKDIIYGNSLSDGKYTFSVAEECDSESSYDCTWHNQGSFETDDLYIHAMIHWK
ncbi:MAG: hypothetical protein SPL52_08260 [Fibrobacter sp.]|nr:hypothetical protein [Fibrobacter sp.]